MLSMLEEVYVHEFLDLERRRRNVFDYVGEEGEGLRGRLTVGHLFIHRQLLHACTAPSSCSNASRHSGWPYSDDSAQTLQYFALRPAVQELLELARGQFFCCCSAAIAGIAGGFEGKVASCGERPVSEVRGMHNSKQTHRPAVVKGAEQAYKSSRNGRDVCRICVMRKVGTAARTYLSLAGSRCD